MSKDVSRPGETTAKKVSLGRQRRPGTIFRSYAGGIGFAFHRAGGANKDAENQKVIKASSIHVSGNSNTQASSFPKDYPHEEFDT